MRGLWSDLELQRGLAADWTFSPGEAARMPKTNRELAALQDAARAVQRR